MKVNVSNNDNIQFFGYVNEEDLKSVACCDVECFNNVCCDDCIFDDDEIHDISNRVVE